MSTDMIQGAYINARVRGMRSELLPRRRFEEFLDMDDVDRLVEGLSNSPYAEEIAEALARFKGADAVEEAVSRNFVKTLAKLKRFAAEETGELIDLFLNRWDLIAVKSLLRQRHAGLDEQQGELSACPGPTLTMALMKSFAQKDTVPDLVGVLVAWNPDLCGGLNAGLAEYNETHELRVLEDALDKGFYLGKYNALAGREDENSQLVRKVLGMEIDRMNLRTILQLFSTQLPVEEKMDRLLYGGTLRHQALKDMASAKSAEDVLEKLGNTKYAELVERLYAFLQTHRYSPMDRMFELLMINELKRDTRTHVFSLAILMEYAWLKYNEVINLRMIARGEAQHLPRGRVREEVLYA